MTRTNIEWTDRTWNFLRGCSRVSEGCRNCYAERTALRFRGPGLAYEGLVRRAESGEPRWTGAVRFVESKLAEPMSWRKPQRVFVNSMSDLFHRNVPFEVLAASFGVMALTPQHTYLILTKRLVRALEFFKWLMDVSDGSPERYCRIAAGRRGIMAGAARSAESSPYLGQVASAEGLWPLVNVQIGASVEDQSTGDERIPQLRALPSWTRWISYEPALGMLSLEGVIRPLVVRNKVPAPIETLHAVAQHRRLWAARRGDIGEGYIDWVVVGGESGPGARQFAEAWADRVIVQCARSLVPVFVKQYGSNPYRLPEAGTPAWDKGLRIPILLKDRNGRDPGEWPESFRYRQLPAPITDAAELEQALAYARKKRRAS